VAFAADSGHRYRVVVANSFANLSNPSCYFTDGNSTFLKIIDCGTVLKADVISFTGRLQNDNVAVLTWMVTGEKNIAKYEIEKSADGIHFNTIGEVIAKKATSLMEYNFNDNSSTNGSSYYRLKMLSPEGLYQNSKTILLSRNYHFQVSSLLNPFSEKITADIVLPQEGFVKMILIDSYGKVARTESQKLYKGLNKVIYQGLQNLASGGYYILFDYNGTQVQKKLTKIN
jgi:hypothetical protein